MNSTSVTNTVVSLSPLPTWALVLLGLGLVAGVVLAGFGLRREPSAQRKAILWGLRILAALCLMGFIFEPAFRQVQTARVKNRVAVIVDRSASMSFPVAPGQMSRSVAAAAVLTKAAPDMSAKSDQFAFDLMGADPELSVMTPEQIGSVPPVGGRTDIMSALRSVKAGEGGSRKLSGVILLSDGADNQELAQGLNERLAAQLKDLNIPVSTVAIGQSGLKDLAIDNVKVDDFAFVRNSITAEVEIHARGFKGQTVTVTLQREGQAIASKQVMFLEDDDTKSVPFTFTPDQTGRFVYTVRTPVFDDEAVRENNSRAFALKVIRDRVRVLLVAGHPSWDERFLRGLLKADANVELISFYIMRTNSDDTHVVDERSELSLIQFPRQEIFDTKIATFDVIIVMNFGHDDFSISMRPFSASISNYVRNGGAIAYVGGDNSFTEGPGTAALDDVLPVSIGGPAEVAAFSPRLTAEGLRHPITALAGQGLGTEAVWNSLPAIPGLNVTRAKPGATVLLDHPFSTLDGKNVPLLAVQDVGRGRSMALMTDGSWYWAFPSHAQGAPTRAYERFWNNAIRWLVRDPELTTLSVAADAPSIEPGKPVGVSVGVRTGDYQPAAGASVVVELISAESGLVIATQNTTASDDGSAHVEFPAPVAGAYKVNARASQNEKVLGEMSDAIAVRAVGPELADARVNRSLLKAMADATGGKAFDADSFSLSDVPLKEPPLVEVGRSKDQPLWDRWYWLLLLVGVMGVEWAARRRFGYV